MKIPKLGIESLVSCGADAASTKANIHIERMPRGALRAYLSWLVATPPTRCSSALCSFGECRPIGSDAKKRMERFFLRRANINVKLPTVESVVHSNTLDSLSREALIRLARIKELRNE